MRKMITVAVSALFLAGFAFAQQPDERRPGQSSSSSTATSAAQDKTVSGCLSKGDSANMYVLTEKDSGNKWNLSESAAASIDFSKHVNHEVRVKGKEMASSASSSSSPSSTQTRPGTPSSTTPSDGKMAGGKSLQVTSIEHVATTCEAKSR
jgi:hypothetical protein